MKLINIPNSRMGMAVASAIALIASAPLAQDTLPKLPFEVNVADYSEDVASAYAVAAKRRDWVQAFESQDVERMMSYYVEDIYSYDLMAAPVGDGLELAFDGAEIWEANWVTFFGLFEDDLEVTIEDLTVYQSGDIATVRGLISRCHLWRETPMAPLRSRRSRMLSGLP